MSWIRVATLPVEADLSQASAYMHQQQVPHRISEEVEGQVVWVLNEAHVEPVKTLLEKLERGELQIEVQAPPERDPRADAAPSDLNRASRLYPVTLILLVLSVIGAALIEFDRNLSIVHWLTFNDVEVRGRYITFASISDTLSSLQLWRLITPIFLHFDIFHILFNGLWLWEFGRRLESVFGGRQFLLLVGLTGLLSNILQYVWQGPSVFGGMSGVLYGLLGFLWIYNLRRPHPMLALPKGIIVLMLVWLVAGTFGLIDLFIDGSVANAAHIGGLLAGMAIAFLLTQKGPERP